MADILARSAGPAVTEDYPLTVVVLTDADPPHNVRVTGRRGGADLHCVAATITLDASARHFASARVFDLTQADAARGVAVRVLAGPVRFAAMTTAEFTRRHGCRSSTPV